MGRRSINTTKSGKYMNPTDQHRKEARKRELRKNKKQRLLVRTAVLKGKDPFQIIADMERLDQMEYNVTTPPPLNEKVLKDKRRKMKETWDRLCRLYVKEDNPRFLELKRMEADYEHKRNQMIKFYESVKSAQEVAIDDIPLPSAPMDSTSSVFNTSLFSSEGPTTQSILKRPNISLTHFKHKSPPGVPPGPPPVLSDVEDDYEDEDSDDEREKSKKIRFSDETPEKDSDVNEFLKEIELMEKSSNVPNEGFPQTIQSIQSLPALTSHQSSSLGPPHNTLPPPPSIRGKSVPSGPPPQQMMMFRAVPPPTNIRGSGQISNVPGLMVGRPPIPTGPPNALRPGLPPQRMLGPRPMMPPMRPPVVPPLMPPNTGSSLAKSGDKKAHFVTDRATIEAKPQLRNLSADATRFTPVALRVKRDEKGNKKPNQRLGFETDFKRYPYGSQSSGLNAPTKDDAYDAFMKEMQNLI